MKRSKSFSPQRFRHAVVARRLSVPEVAEAIEVSRWTLTAWLSQRSDPPVVDVRMMEMFLKVPAGFLEGAGKLDVLEM